MNFTLPFSTMNCRIFIEDHPISFSNYSSLISCTGVISRCSLHTHIYIHNIISSWSIYRFGKSVTMSLLVLCISYHIHPTAYGQQCSSPEACCVGPIGKITLITDVYVSVFSGITIRLDVCNIPKCRYDVAKHLDAWESF